MPYLVILVLSLLVPLGESIIIDNGEYSSEFTQICNTYASYTAAAAACTALGSEWYLASIPTLEGLTAIRAMMGKPYQSSFVGVTGILKRWTSGRLKNIAFWYGPGAAAGGYPGHFIYPSLKPNKSTFSYNPFGGTEPNGDSAELCAVLHGDILFNGTMADVPCTGARPCAICERSLCQQTVDCYWPNTATMGGLYYPSCTCTCKPGFSGARCQYPFIHDHGPYSSEYQHVCPGTAATQAASQARCTALGTEWGLATFPTNASLQAYRGLLNLPLQDGWVGANDSDVEGKWVWSHGRLAGVQFWQGDYTGHAVTYSMTTFNATYNLTSYPFDPAEPQSVILGTDEDCAMMGSTSNPTTSFVDVACSGTRACVACERSPCRLNTDCYEPNTINMTGDYYPSCKCTCRVGSWGDQCQFNVTFDQGAYVSEYTKVCSTGYTYATAAAACAALGTEWALASFPTRGSLDAYRNTILAPFQPHFVGASDSVTDGLWLWQFGRLKGIPFWLGNGTHGRAASFSYPSYPNLTKFEYNPWGGTEPNGGPAEGCAILQNYPTIDRNFGDINCTSIPRPCAVCERSPCRLEGDCYAPNTLYMNGTYYPSCNCTCKPGFSGARCQYPFIHDHGPYSSEYQHVCRSTTANQLDSQARCTVLGTGWVLASFPTDESLQAYRGRLELPLQTTYVGANDSTVEGKWVWSHGRLAGVQFWQGSNDGYTTPFTMKAFNSTKVFESYPWDPTEPHSHVSAGDEDCAIMGSTLSIVSSFADVSCNSLRNCVSCERSSCRLNTDCSADGTHTMLGDYFPNCSCRCLSTYRGRACKSINTASVSMTALSTNLMVPAYTLSVSNREIMFRSKSGPQSLYRFLSITSSISTLSSTHTRSMSRSCRNFTDVNIQDTCEVLRLAEWLPPTENVIPIVASLVYGNSNCTTLRIPFAVWTGRRGADHYLRILVTDPRVPIYRGSELPNPVSDSVLFTSVATESTVGLRLNFATEVEISAARRRGLVPPGVGGNLTVQFQVAVARVTYQGGTTLNQVKYRLDCGSWYRCPITMSSVFEVTLLASDNIFPVSLKETIAVGSAIASIGSGLTVSPSVVAQLGVLTSLRQMSRCGSPDPDEEGSDDYDHYARGSLNPFGISIGEGGGALRYVRGSMVMTVVYSLCLSTLMFTYTTASSRISHYLGAKAGSPPSLLTGYPSALVAVGSFVMDGAASAGVVLGVQGAKVGDWAMGWLAVFLCIVFVSQMILATVRWLPPSLVAAHLPEVAFSVHSVLKWLGSATHKWAGTDRDKAADQWMRRYEGYVADLKVPWYGGLEQAVALALCILAAIPVGEPVFCAARGAVCTLLVAVQGAVMVVLRPMVHRWRCLLMSIVLVLQTTVAALSIANAQLQEQQIELAMDTIGAIIFVLVLAAFAIDLSMMLLSLMAAAKRWVRSKGTMREENEHESDSYMLAEIVEPLMAPTSVISERSSIEVQSESDPPPRDLTATDSDAVRQILDQLRDFELAMEHI